MFILARQTTIGLTALLMAASIAEAQGALARKANTVALEVGGRPLILGFNYERYFTPRVGVGMGFGVGENEDDLLLPLYVSWHPVGETHSLYLGAGVTIETWGFTKETWPTVTVGYEYRGKDRVVVRPTITYFSDKGRGGSGVWPGVMIGTRF